MKRFKILSFLIGIALLLIAGLLLANKPSTTIAAGTDRYVSPSGSSSGDGTIGNPWDMQTALSGGNGVVQPGDTIWLRGGTYVAPTQVNYGGETVNGLYISTLQGTQNAPIIVRQYPGERATVDGGLESTGTWNTFWGFEIINSKASNRTRCPTDLPGGLTLLGRGGKAINMVIHDTGHSGIGFWRPVGDGGELYGNLMWAIGIYDTCTSPGTPESPWTRGAAFYMQNIEGTRYIGDNISFWNFTTGMKAYGQDTDGFEFDGNVAFNNGYYNMEVIANGAETKRLKLTDNFTYRHISDGGAGVIMGIYSPGVYDPGQDVLVDGNYFVNGDIIPWPDPQGNYPSGAMMLNDYSDVTVTNNTFVGGILVEYLETVRNTSRVWNNNTYFSTRNAEPNFPLGFYDARQAPEPTQIHGFFFDGWKSYCNCDANSTYTPNRPTTNAIFVRPNKYEAGRANIIVYNWENLNSISANVSNVLTVGDTYEIRDAQNFYGTPLVTGTYAGGSVTIPMTSTAVSVPLGTIVVNPVHTSSEFGVFVLLKTGVSVPDPDPENPGDPEPPPPGASPSLGAVSASNVTSTSATLNSSITSIGSNTVSNWGFHYGTTASYGSEAVQTGSINVSSFSNSITGLTCNTTYHYRATATNNAGTINSSDATFTTSACPAANNRKGGSKKRPLAIEADMSYVAEYPVATSTATTTKMGVGDGYFFTRLLQFGSVGEDVRKLQQFLNRNNFTIAPTGVGSPGNEITVFGSRTKSALIRFQNTYADEILKPLNLKTGTGILGVATRNKINAMNARGSIASNSTSSVVANPVVPVKVISNSVPFKRRLQVGDNGNDVARLQYFLNTHGFPVNTLGRPGSLGHESRDFGPSTAAALAKYQNQNKAEILKIGPMYPGIFGWSSVNFVNSKLD